MTQSPNRFRRPAWGIFLRRLRLLITWTRYSSYLNRDYKRCAELWQESAAEIFAELKGALVDFQKFRRNARRQRILPRRRRYVDAEQDDVHSPLTARLSRKCQAVHYVDFDARRTNFFDEVCGILRRARDDRHRVDLLRVRDDLPARLQIRQPTRRFQNLERHDEICRTTVDDGRINFVAETNISYHGAAALAHAVNFRNFNVEALVKQQVSQNFAGEQRALPADADNDDVFSLHGSSLLRTHERFFRAKLTAHAATDALSLVDERFAVLHADGGATDFHARFTTDTLARVDFERRFMFDGLEQGARSTADDNARLLRGKFLLKRGVAFGKIVRVDDADAINPHCAAKCLQVDFAGRVALDVQAR